MIPLGRFCTILYSLKKSRMLITNIRVSFCLRSLHHCRKTLVYFNKEGFGINLCLVFKS